LSLIWSYFIGVRRIYRIPDNPPSYQVLIRMYQLHGMPNWHQKLLRDEEDHIHPPKDIAPQDTGELLGENHEDVIPPSKQRRARAQLESATLEKVKQLDLDQLRKKVVHHAKYKRLNIDDRVALDEAYHDYQKRGRRIDLGERQITTIFANTMLKQVRFSMIVSPFAHLFYFISMSNADWLAIRNPDSISNSEQKKACGLLWKALNAETKEKFKDPGYLATLPNPFGQDDETGSPPTIQQKKNKHTLNSEVL
ncbi:hypothetical protein VP01_7959g1, partial [Puccinia sorghi]